MTLLYAQGPFFAVRYFTSCKADTQGAGRVSFLLLTPSAETNIPDREIPVN